MFHKGKRVEYRYSVTPEWLCICHCLFTSTRSYCNQNSVGALSKYDRSAAGVCNNNNSPLGGNIVCALLISSVLCKKKVSQQQVHNVSTLTFLVTNLWWQVRYCKLRAFSFCLVPSLCYTWKNISLPLLVPLIFFLFFVTIYVLLTMHLNQH